MKKISSLVIILFFLFTKQGQAEKALKANVSNKFSRMIVISKVVEALGKIGDLRASDVLIEALQSKEYFIRYYAAQSLGRLQDNKAAPFLLKRLTADKNYLVRVSASRALVEMGSLDRKDSLLSFLSDESPEIRASAVEQLGEGLEEEYLLSLLTNETNSLVCIRVIEQLGKARYEPSLPYIRKFLSHENARVRTAACFALGQISDRRDESLLLEKIKDKDPSVRSAAKYALSKLRPAPVSPRGRPRRFPPPTITLYDILWEDVSSNEPVLRASSYLGLANLNDTKILPLLLKDIVAPSNTTLIRLEAARALRVLKPHISELAARALTSSKSPGLSLENLGLIYTINARPLLDWLVEALKDNQNPLYYDAPLIILALRDTSGLAFLRQELFNNDLNLVATCAYVLGEFADKESFEELIEVYQKYKL